MAISIIVIVLVVAGFALSRTRFAKELNSRRYMPFVYAAAAIYCGARVYGAVSSEARVWPHALLGVLFLAGVVDSTRASGILRKS
ncbi:MAG: hypothetical protein WC674_02880 [Candidatus Krumholzibacteriia bacterium]